MDLPKDPVRIVYHAENRTFARLFYEHSLEQVKDVVRRKLGLGRETDVSLKQMGPDSLLDLEDDDDFQAFRVLLKSSVSADIQVTVGRPQGPPMPPSVAPQPREQPLATEPPIYPSLSRSKEPTSQSCARAEVASTTEPSTATRKTPDLSARKRKVSFGDVAAVSADKPAERRAQSKTATVTSVSSAKVAETPTPVPAGSEEPPKKKQKKETVKAKDVQPTEGVESPTTKTSRVPKSKVKTSAAVEHGSEARASAPKDSEASEPSVKKPKRQKKDDSTVPKQSSMPASPDDGMELPVHQSSSPVAEYLLPVRPVRSVAGSGVSKTRLSEALGACATVPRTSESACVQSEVAAAILSSYLSRSNVTIPPPPPPPPKRKYVRKNTNKPSAPSAALLVTSSTVSHVPANGIPGVPTEPRLEQVIPTNEPPQRSPGLNGPPCPICLEEPFHIRYRCPTVLNGPDAIRERLEEVKRTNAGDQQSLIKELEGLLRDSEVASEPSLSAAPSHDIQSREALQLSNLSICQTPNIPSNSNLSEVTVESRDEGSSSEDSDDMLEGRIEQLRELPAHEQGTLDKQSLPSLDDLETVIRGPALKRQSILGVLDRIVGDDENSDSEEDGDEGEVELDEEIDRAMRRLSKRIMRSSDSESGEEESRSSSLSRPVKDNLESGLQSSNDPAEGSIRHPDDDVVRDFTDPPALGGQDNDSSEETHVGSEDRMVVDDSNGEKGATAIVEGQHSSPALRTSVLPLDAPSNEPQESEKREVDPASNRNGGAPVASEIPNEAEADPIEPVDDIEPPDNSCSSNADPIEAPPEDIESLFTGVTQSTPNPGVTKRIKTRNGQILNDEAERPVLLEQLTSEATEEAPLLAKGKSRRKVTETSVNQEPTPIRRSPRFNSLPPSTSTPVAVALLNHRAKVGIRSSKAARTPAKPSEQRTDASQSGTKDDNARNRVHVAPTPSLIEWETLAEPSSSPSQQLNEPSVHIDELMSSSPPQPDDNPIRGRLNGKEKQSQSRKATLSSEAESSQRKERLFDLSSSQIPFPYSQHKNAAPTVFPNGKEREAATDSEEEAMLIKKRAKLPARYRSLSQLASEATFFSPTLPTPANKSVTYGKSKKRVANKDSSSSSSSSDEDEANRSEHIPRGRRAGSVLETKRKKSLLSKA